MPSASRVMSGMRPTGRLHIGHLVGALTQFVDFMETTDAFFEVADVHAYTTAFSEPDRIRAARTELVLDWLAAGLDPEKCTMFLQSAVPEIFELHTLLSMITPVSWLERVPTYKGQIEELGPEIATYGFLGYPLLQLCDIAVFGANRVPVGKDQVSHLEFAREVVRRFNSTYGKTLVEPEATLSDFPLMLGTDGRKMSKSYNNTIDIADTAEATTKKVRSMVTDPQKVRRHDPGRPEICPVFALHHLSTPKNRIAEIDRTCRTGELGCVACKTELAETLNERLAPVRERRAQFDPATVDAILAKGSAKAREVANETMRAVRSAMKLT